MYSIGWRFIITRLKAGAPLVQIYLLLSDLELFLIKYNCAHWSCTISAKSSKWSYLLKFQTGNILYQIGKLLWCFPNWNRFLFSTAWVRKKSLKAFAFFFFFKAKRWLLNLGKCFTVTVFSQGRFSRYFAVLLRCTVLPSAERLISPVEAAKSSSKHQKKRKTWIKSNHCATIWSLCI